MASNKSKTLYQKLLGLKGKRELYSEYIDFYRELLDEKAAEKEAISLAKNKEELDEVGFYLKSDEEIYAALLETDVKEKEDELNLQYRKRREELRRNLAKESQVEFVDNATLLAKHGAELEEYRHQLDAELEKFKADLKEQIKQEKEREQTGIANGDMAKKYAELEASLKAKAEQEKASLVAKNEKKVAKNTKKMKAKIAKLDVQIEKVGAELKVLQEENARRIGLPEEDILRVTGLCMYFGGLHAVEDLSFEVRKGEIFGLIGPNGAGKTTVFNCITQFYHPTKGDIAFRTRENESIDMNEEIVHDIITLGMARTFQNVEVIPECTVLENMLIAANRQYQSTLIDHVLHTKLLKLEEQVITKRALKVLEFMGLSQYANNFAMGLPYGILKKIEISRTLMVNPQLVILDEPAAGLNDSETKELAQLIRTIREEYDCTILLIEHDMGLVMDICDRICAISFGKLLAIGTPAEIQSNRLVQEAYLGVEDEEEA